MIKIFLSASIPIPTRDHRFFDSADIVAIREAVKGLVEEVVPRGQIVFGGHPAITPLIALLLQGYQQDLNRRLVIYQSGYFAKNFVPENREFVDLRLIPPVTGSKKRSIAVMRKRMIEETQFDAGVFIGGMDGILEEHRLFRKIHPHADCWPIGSTGAAAMEILKATDNPKADSLLKELTYPTLFRQLIKQIPH